MIVRIVRVESSSRGTRGIMLINGCIKFATLEDEWRDNQPNISCIPSGSFSCARIISPHFGPTFTVQNVPGRSLIRFHAGNTDADTTGCILVGMGFAEKLGRPGISESAKAFIKFMDSMRGIDSFELQITNCTGVDYGPLLPSKL